MFPDSEVILEVGEGGGEERRENLCCCSLTPKYERPSHCRAPPAVSSSPSETSITLLQGGAGGNAHISISSPTTNQKTKNKQKKTALFCYRSRSTPSSLLLSAAAQVRPKKSNTIRVSVCDRTVPLVRPSRRKTLLLQRHVFTGINVPAPYC